MDEIIANDPRALAALRDAVERGIALEPYVFARLIGRPEYTVSKAWKNGQLPSEAGCIPVREGLVAVVSCGGLRRDKKPVPSFICDAEKRARELLGLPPRDDTPQSEGDGNSAEIAAWRLKYLKAQTAARTAAAQAKQMENELAKGQLVKAAEVELDAAETATNIAGVLSRIPERAAGMCVGCSAEEIAAILRKEISLALDAIQASAFTGDWSGVL
jgi:hypothetical protein